jgi:tetratricopeptide (TPR) repeat protein
LQSGLRLQPESSYTYLVLGLLAAKRRDFAQAVVQIDHALRRCGPEEMARPQALKGDYLYRSKDYANAVKACERALKLRPQDAGAEGIRAQALLHLKDFAAAERAFTRYLELGGKPDPDIYVGRGQASVQLGKYAAAVRDYSLALERRADAEVYNHRGWAYYFCDAWKLALADFDQALGLAPQQIEAHIGRGLARVMLGQYRAAAADADTSWQQPPRTVEMLHNLACLFAQVADKARADAAAPDGAALAERCSNQAVQALQKALALLPPEERGPFWRARMQPDDALNPIRDSAGFKRLAAEYAPPPTR